MNDEGIQEVFNSNRTKNEKIAYLLEKKYSRDDILKYVKCCPNTGSVPDQLSPGRLSKRTPVVVSFVSQQTISNPLISGKELSM